MPLFRAAGSPDDLFLRLLFWGRVLFLLFVAAVLFGVGFWAGRAHAQEARTVEGGTGNAGDSVDVAIVFVVDVSGSMSKAEVETARGSHAAALRSAEVTDAIVDSETGRIAIAYVEFGAAASTRIDWTVLDGPASAAAIADRIDALGPAEVPTDMTAVGDGLMAADGLFQRLPLAARRLVVDIVSDGTALGGAPVALWRDSLLARGAVINAMPLMFDPDSDVTRDWYRADVAAGPGHFVVPIRSIDEMPAALRSKIVLELF